MVNKIAKPFLKWAGGKTQLINSIDKSLPFEIAKSKFTYIEPFVGSGAVLFWMLNKNPKKLSIPFLVRLSATIPYANYAA